MTILDSLKEVLNRKTALRVNKFGEYTSYDLKVIVALFVLSAAYSDGKVNRDERMALLRVLEKQFLFSDSEAVQVLEVAEFLLEKDHSLQDFACQIQKNFEEAQRVTLLAMYIQILEADGVVTTDEMIGLEQILKLLQLDRSNIDVAKEILKEEKRAVEQ
ncbi:MAG: TerB family tellurite resistance protein [Bdellovibrionales bacterium]|nr:TerB family tellurite resistance protein [Bdellovibrionales bacterium]